MAVTVDALAPVQGDPNRPTVLPLWEPEHEALRQSARAFVAAELAPHAEEWETAQTFPREVFTTVGAAGFLGLKFAPEWGGSGPDYLAEAAWLQELVGCGAAGVAADIGAHADLACLYVDRFGSDAQRERYLRRGITGEWIGSLAVTEPDAGSDVAGIRTRARRDGDDWVLSGSKIFVTGGARCDWLVLAAKTDADAGHAGVSLFVLDAETPGITRSRMTMLGWRTSHTGEIALDEVRLPGDALLGSEGQGFYAIMKNFAWERLSMSLGAVAGAQRTLDVAIAYAKQRHQFERPISSFQVWRHRFADLATDIAVAKALTEHALRMYVNGEDALREVAMCKLVTQRLAFRVADECVQVHGGYGYMMEFPAQRYWRDSRLGPIGGGTDEIMREIIAKTYGL